MNRFSTAIAIAIVSLIASGSALADGKKICATEPEASWKPIADAEAKTATAGFEVRKSKIAGTCYEVYGIDSNGKLFELFYHPVTLELVMTVEK
jgi:hypothetical protein